MNADLENSLWYTGSTIAQTLSGSAGLLGAIMLFALQETSRSIQRAAGQLTEIPHSSMNSHFIRHLLARRSFHELAHLYGEQLQKSSTEMSMELLAQHSTLALELDHDRRLRQSFWRTLLPSGIVIGMSIICCALSPRLSSHPAIGWTLLILLVAGTVGCLILYGVLFRELFRATPTTGTSA